MKSNSQQPPEPPDGSQPDPEFLAQQLRRPSGDFAKEVGQKMDQVNKPLYDLMLDTMELQENDRILEIGFGTGKFFDDLFAKQGNLQISGIDFSEAMVNTAKKYNRESTSSGKLKIEQASSEAIPYADETFDNVFCNMVIYFWDQPEIHLREVNRVLKSGGKFYTGMRTRKSMKIFPFVEHGFNLYSMDEWKEILVNNGFSFVDKSKRVDPKMDFEGMALSLESCCIVAEKKAVP